jgi:hypothetical protein
MDRSTLEINIIYIESNEILIIDIFFLTQLNLTKSHVGLT